MQILKGIIENLSNKTEGSVDIKSIYSAHPAIAAARNSATIDNNPGKPCRVQKSSVFIREYP
jgi:hypothetical protein